MTFWPNLYLIGVAKAATTTLHEILGQHPDICMSSIKEPHYFTENIVDLGTDKTHNSLITNEEDYQALFKTCDEGKSLFKGESSPSYFWEHGTARKIRQRNPDAKAVVILRNPLTRIMSHYNMDFRAGREQEVDLLSAVRKDIDRTSKGWGISRLYLELGLYHEALSNYSEEFGSSLKVLFYEDLRQNKDEFLEELFGFLGLAVPSLPSEPHANAGYYYSNKTKFLKRIPFSHLVPKSIKDKINGFLLSKKPEELSSSEVQYLTEYYRQDQINIAKDFGIDRYLNAWSEEYGINF